GPAELDLACDLGELAAVPVDDHDADLVWALGLEPVELEHDREVDAERCRQLFPVAAGDAAGGDEEEAFAHLREVGEHRSGDFHEPASVGGGSGPPWERGPIRPGHAALGWHTRVMTAEHRIETEAELRALIGSPAELVCTKVTDK